MHSQFNKLTMDDARVDSELRRFLPHAFSLKAVADYETGPDAVVSAEQVETAIVTATRFVECVTALLA